MTDKRMDRIKAYISCPLVHYSQDTVAMETRIVTTAYRKPSSYVRTVTNSVYDAIGDDA